MSFCLYLTYYSDILLLHPLFLENILNFLVKIFAIMKIVYIFALSMRTKREVKH